MARATLTVGIPNFGTWCGDDWRDLLDVAVAADQAGVDRLSVVDHVVMGPNTSAYSWGRFPTPPDGAWLEPLTVLTGFAAATSRARLSTGILVAPLRPAALLAKTVATLDVLSGGRVDLGVGVGWQAAEFAATGLDFTQRGQRLDDTIAACRELWSRLPASYSSATTTFADVYCSPQPVQERVPVWFSGTPTARNVRRIAELGDGWIPIMGASVADIAAGTARLREAAGRPLTVQAPPRMVTASDGSRDIAATMAGVPDLLAAGVTDVSVNIAAFAAGPDDAPAALDRLVREFGRVVA